MREEIINELIQIWCDAENCLADHECSRALELKEIFTIKLEKYNLTIEELNELKQYDF